MTTRIEPKTKPIQFFIIAISLTVGSLAIMTLVMINFPFVDSAQAMGVLLTGIMIISFGGSSFLRWLGKKWGIVY